MKSTALKKIGEPRPRPVRARGYVWCDHHGSIHEAKPDVYDEGGDDAEFCLSANWRPIYVLGVPGEDFS